MIIIPEKEMVLILVPRVASTSLKDAVLKRYGESFLIYRHMEADGVPKGYDRWIKMGFIRNPIDRLWSLYKYLRSFDGPYEREYLRKQRQSVNDIGFSEKFYPRYNVGHALPETKKSQFIYLRPDLGTKIYKYDEIEKVCYNVLDIEIGKTNCSHKEVRPMLTQKAIDHINIFFEWDLSFLNS